MTVVWELRRPDGTMLAWMASRPAYCDRGRWHAMFESEWTIDHRQSVWHSDADPWPRYYFDLDRGKAEVGAYLDAKKVKRKGAKWHKMDTLAHAREGFV